VDLGLAGKNVVVTGASRGIGRAIAMQFAEEGANVALCARGLKALDATRAAVEERGVRAYASACDVADSEALGEFLANAKTALGGVDVLVNNASALADTDDEAGWRSSIDIDLLASVRATQTVVPWMEAAGGGCIVHISSISGLEPGSPPAYSAVKAALFNHAKTMAELLAVKNIRINCVAPGSIYFPGGLWADVKRDDREAYDAVVQGIPFGRMGHPEEVADAVVFIASARASWISGTNLVVDGVQHKGIF